MAESHGVSLKASALQFTSAHPAVAVVIPGSTRTDRINEGLEALQETISEAFWQELIEELKNNSSQRLRHCHCIGKTSSGWWMSFYLNRTSQN
ncbi:aldo/keto reductase [Shouchella miscanthi]|uniref:aldo/keto reductase n=1 Tax=Shouchella miscanthi TaxID=2598861 RepID=UPI00346373DC